MRFLVLIFVLLFSFPAFSVTTASFGGQSKCESLFEGGPKFDTFVEGAPAPLGKNPETLRDHVSESSFWKMVDEASDQIPFQPSQQLWIQPLLGNQRIPLDRKLYQNTRFVKVVDGESAKLEKGEYLIRGPIEFGYTIRGESRRIGVVEYYVMDSAGRVVEVGGRSHEVVREFKDHLLGRVLTKAELNTISEINRKIIEELRAHPEAKEKLAAFVKKRKWPLSIHSGRSLDDIAQLAYFSDKFIDIKSWAKKNGYTWEQMRDAGWLLLQFNQRGMPSFGVIADDAIRIPMFDTAGNMPVWRSRLNNPRPKQGKYQSWPMNRAVDRDLTIAESLYNGWKLDPNLKLAEGKTIIVTEGEFKCLVASEMTNHIVLGIPGITQFTPEMGQAIRNANPAEVVVILDRDPRAKALQRVDEITDSERAAYQIAREIERQGVAQVRVGTLPNVFDGGKVGLDDLLLAKGVEPLTATLRDALKPAEYARQRGLNERLDQVHVLLQRVSKVLLRNYVAKKRGLPSLSPVVLSELKKAERKLRREYEKTMARSFEGAKTFQTPAVGLEYIADLKANQSNDLLMTLDSGAPVPKQKLNGTILLLNFESTEKLTHDFPTDDYTYEYSVNMKGSNGTTSQAPVVIFKGDYEKVVAIGWMGVAPEQLAAEARRTHSLFGR